MAAHDEHVDIDFGVLEGDDGHDTDDEFGSQSTLIPVCDFFRAGHCRKGNFCDFSHDPLRVDAHAEACDPLRTVTDDAAALDLNELERIRKYSRRPLVHVIVLLASNKPVVKYTEDLCAWITAAGMDVALQTRYDYHWCRQAAAAPWTHEAQSQFNIEPSHLANLLTHSHGDFTVVIGNRNAERRSLQIKHKGVLLEMDRTTFRRRVWDSWPQNDIKYWNAISALTDVELSALLTAYTSLDKSHTVTQHFNHDAMQLITMWHQMGIPPPGIVVYNTPFFYDQLVHVHKMAADFHLTLRHAYGMVTTMLHARPMAPLKNSTGTMKLADYKPLNDISAANTIAPLLQSRLANYLHGLMYTIESACCAVDCIAPTGFWTPYYHQHLATWNPGTLGNVATTAAPESALQLPLVPPQLEPSAAAPQPREDAWVDTAAAASEYDADAMEPLPRHLLLLSMSDDLDAAHAMQWIPVRKRPLNKAQVVLPPSPGDIPVCISPLLRKASAWAPLVASTAPAGRFKSGTALQRAEYEAIARIWNNDTTGNRH